MSVPDVLSPQERLVLNLRGLYESYGYTRFPMRRFEEYALYLENKSFSPARACSASRMRAASSWRSSPM